MQVICLVGAQKASLHPDDMLLLSNFVVSSESFRYVQSLTDLLYVILWRFCFCPDYILISVLSLYRTSESFSPICLPRYNPMAFLYAYVHYFDVRYPNFQCILNYSIDSYSKIRNCWIQYSLVTLDKKLFLLVDYQQMTHKRCFCLQVDTYLILLTTSSGAFYHLKDCRWFILLAVTLLDRSRIKCHFLYLFIFGVIYSV